MQILGYSCCAPEKGMARLSFLLLLSVVFVQVGGAVLEASDSRVDFAEGVPTLLRSGGKFHRSLEKGESPSPLQLYGVPITIPFPNSETLLGLGGIAYNEREDIWTCSAENIVGTSQDAEYSLASKPRLYHLRLNFTQGIFKHDRNLTMINPGDGLKLEDLDKIVMDKNSNETFFWLASEANSDLIKTSKYLSKDFGSPDLSSFDPESFFTSRLVRVNEDGRILEEAIVPDFAQWDLRYDWDSNECIGDRPFQGFHALTITPQNASTSRMLVGMQAALYQDGPTPNRFSGSSTRILHYSIDHNIDASNNTATATYIRSYRYDTSPLTLNSVQKSAKHFNGLFGMLALSENELLMIETEDFDGFGTRSVIQRIFYTVLDSSAAVDHCYSLNDCDVAAPLKYLVWEGNMNYQLDAITFGPAVFVDGQEVRTIALVFEDDFNIGARFELYTIDVDMLREFVAGAEPYATSSDIDHLLKKRTMAMIFSLAGICLLFGFQLWLVHRESHREVESNEIDTNTPDQNPNCGRESSGKASQATTLFSFDYYLLATSMMNSFLVGGVTFGFPGMALMLRKEGCYAGSCSCGSFCAAEKEQLALVSTIGFFITIGSRLFLGLLMDAQGPKVTAILSGTISLAGTILLAVGKDLQQVFIYSWCLLSLGGAGMHIVGFHVTNLFPGTGKKTASASISAAFGASSAIFPIMQVFNQYTEIGLQELASGYSVLVFFILVNNFLVQPWARVKPGESATRDMKFWRSKWWNRNFKKSPFLSIAFQETRKFEFWGECLHFSTNLLLLTYYLSTVAQLMYEKGDIKFTTEPNSWTDYMFTRTAGWMNSLGFLWFPIVQLVLKRSEWPGCFAFVSAANTIVVLIVMIPVLEIQIIAMVILSLSRLALFSYHHAYIIEKVSPSKRRRRRLGSHH